MNSKEIERLKTRRRPMTPGKLVAGLIGEAEITQGELAKALQGGRQTVNHLINDKRAVTPDIAHRLGRYFGNGPALRLNLQHAVDVWDVLHADTSEYELIEPVKSAA